ncbi:MAG: hypothetical protein ACM3MG_03330, partial [Bacillota bacterium]
LNYYLKSLTGMVRLDSEYEGGTALICHDGNSGFSTENPLIKNEPIRIGSDPTAPSKLHRPDPHHFAK